MGGCNFTPISPTPPFFRVPRKIKIIVLTYCCPEKSPIIYFKNHHLKVKIVIFIFSLIIAASPLPAPPHLPSPPPRRRKWGEGKCGVQVSGVRSRGLPSPGHVTRPPPLLLLALFFPGPSTWTQGRNKINVTSCEKSDVSSKRTCFRGIIEHYKHSKGFVLPHQGPSVFQRLRVTGRHDRG